MIPVSTTTVAWQHSDQDGTKDLRSPPVYTDYATGVRAVIGGPSGNETVSAGSREDVTFRLDCDPVAGALHTDRVRDEATGEVYQVIWVKQRRGMGLDHTVADLLQVTDRVSA